MLYGVSEKQESRSPHGRLHIISSLAPYQSRLEKSCTVASYIFPRLSSQLKRSKGPIDLVAHCNDILLKSCLDSIEVSAYKAAMSVNVRKDEWFNLVQT